MTNTPHPMTASGSAGASRVGAPAAGTSEGVRRRRRRGFARRLSAKEHWDLHYGPNMTPMVDVVMVILVFFMTSASVLGPQWFLRSAIPVAAPVDAAAPTEPTTRVSVAISRSPEGGAAIRVDGVDVPGVDRLESLLSEAAGKSGAAAVAVLISPADDVPYEDIVRVHELCERLEIRKVGLTRGAERSPPEPVEPADR